MLESLKSATLWQVVGFFLMANIVIFLCSVTSCWLLGRIFGHRRIFDRWEPLRPVEISAAMGAILLNAAVSVAGWALWKTGYITLRESTLPAVLLDCVLMILFMDLGMYVFHRLAHHPRLYPLFHRFHHRHETTNPISLFVLHPVEVAGFGALMILFLMVYPMTVGGLLAYLTINVLFGTLGHSGVEPLPRGLQTIPLLRLIGTSTFHAEHHEHRQFNFGFYTLVWDKLFGTLDPEYEARFAGRK
jgi:sterol desaturase/sphingolipid hydroxylase (fatty acid hydroxylase superfamily)